MRKALETKLVKAFVFSIYILFVFTLTAGIKRKRKYNTPKYIGIQL